MNRHPADIDFPGKPEQLMSYYNDGWVSIKVEPTVSNKIKTGLVNGQYSWVDDIYLLDHDDSTLNLVKSYIDTIPLLKWYQHIFGQFDDFKLECFQVTAGETLHWHNECMTGWTIKLALHWVSEWKESYGGHLIFGRAPVTSKGLPFGGAEELIDFGDIAHQRTIIPKDGEGILWNNMDPCLIHKVTPVTEKNEIRYTVTVRLGYKANTQCFHLYNI
ncbi:MAG: hypothetical protein DRQ88_12395 [Epsilonproteobacteria bacterium]|nr:MAG: hypothetical protein DRQ88_12395 [Campylobacterota bacterium]